MKVRGQTVYSPVERIERLSIPEPMSGCWLWLGSIRYGSSCDYGHLVVGSRSNGTRRTVGAHRYSYETFKGAIPDGFHVCHSCDNSLCVNPEHLFAGTRQQNTDDRDRKGRNVAPVGEKNGRAKITAGIAANIKWLLLCNEHHAQIANLLNVPRTIVKAISRQKAWRNVIPDPPVTP